MTWPLLLDYTRDECKRTLRKLELEAYASMVTAFRAQGDLTKEKKKMLQELCVVLSISLERHRAEVRRAVNDEKLNTIADRMIGPNTGMEWATEGRRLVPLLPRLVPQTAFTVLANNLANIQAAKNAAMPIPSATGIKIDTTTTDEISQTNKRKRSSSIDSPTSPSKPPFAISPQLLQQIQQISPQHQTSSSPVIQTNLPPSSSINPAIATVHTSNLSGGMTSSTPSVFAQGSTMTPAVSPSRNTPQPKGGIHRMIAPAGTIPHHSSKQQVILVSGSGGTIPPSILQRCLSVPIVKAMSTTSSSNTLMGKTGSTTNLSTTNTQITPISVSSPSGTQNSGNMVVYTTTTRARPLKGPNSGGARQPRPRPSLVAPLHMQPQPGMLGMSPALQFPTLIGGPGKNQNVRGPSPTTVMGKGGPRMTTLKGESAAAMLKLASQAASAASSTRILPKPSALNLPTTVSGTNILISPSSTSTSPLMVVGGPTTTKANKSGSNTPRIVNVMSVTPAPVRQPPTNTYSSKGNRLTPSTSKTATSSIVGSSSNLGGIKPNVIVVHKAHAWPQTQQQQLQIMQQQNISQSTHKIQLVKKSEHKTVAAALKSKYTSPDSKGMTIKRIPANLSNLPSTLNLTELDPTQYDPKNTLLADLIQAAGISPDGSPVSLHGQTSLTTGAIKKIQTAVTTLPNLPLLSPATSTRTFSQMISGTSTSASHSITVSKVSAPSSSKVKQDAIESDFESKAALVSPSKILLSEVPILTEKRTIDLKELAKSDKSEEDTMSAPESFQAQNLEHETVQMEILNETSTIDDSSTSVSYQEIVQLPIVNQLQEGQVLEIQAPDAANLLNASGQLSKEVLDLLQQVGIQFNQDQVTLDTSGLGEVVHVETSMQEEGIEGVALTGEVQLDPTTGMLFLQQSEPDVSEEIIQTETVYSTITNPESMVDVNSLQILQDTGADNVIQQDEVVDINLEAQLQTELMPEDGTIVITDNNEPMENDQCPFQNLVVGECVTVSIGGEGGDCIGSSVEIGSEMETVISQDYESNNTEGQVGHYMDTSENIAPNSELIDKNQNEQS